MDIRNKNLNINYSMHNHTKRCGHAYGEDEEYVLNAIQEGFLHYGFSDHGMFLDMRKRDYGRDANLLEDYINSVNNLREKYKDKINIYLGFEIEYDKNHLDYYKELYNKYGFDYLICGQHFYIKNKKAHYYFNEYDDIEMIKKYKDDLIEAMKTGLFTYIAHPDLFFNRITKITDEILAICEEIVLASIKYDIPLEVNLGAMRYGNLMAQINGTFPYPNHYFFEIAKKYNAKIVIGIDSHNPNDLVFKRDLDFAKNFIEKHELNIINDFNDSFIKNNK